MTTTLKLAPTNTFSNLIEEFVGMIDGQHDVDFRKYGTTSLDLVEFTNVDNGLSIRVVFDPNGTMKHRQGIHTTLSIDAYELGDLMDQADRDCFDTIWIH